MLPKVTLLTRIRDEAGRYTFVPIDVNKGQAEPIEGGTSYYLRFTQNGKRKTEPVGKDLSAAIAKYQNRELDIARARVERHCSSSGRGHPVAVRGRGPF